MPERSRNASQQLSEASLKCKILVIKRKHLCTNDESRIKPQQFSLIFHFLLHQGLTISRRRSGYFYTTKLSVGLWTRTSEIYGAVTEHTTLDDEIM